MSFVKPKSAADAQRTRDRLAKMSEMFPKAGIFNKMIANYDRKFGTSANPPAAAPTQADPAAGMGGGPLSNNDPRSLTDPRNRSNVSKTMLGQ